MVLNIEKATIHADLHFKTEDIYIVKVKILSAFCVPAKLYRVTVFTHEDKAL